jgi:hypothetical protein
MSSPNLREIPRDRLMAVFKNAELVLLFEDIIRTLNDTLPGDTSAVEAALAGHIADTDDAHQASAIGATPGGSRASITVQGQLGELDSAKLAASLVSAFMLTLLNDADAVTARGTLGLGSIATQSASNVAITGGSIALGSGVLGYATGNGGTVIQATSKATGVTLNKVSGDITLDAAALAADTVVSFTLTNSNIGVGDLVHAVHNSAGTNGAYGVTAQVLSGGSCLISVRNLTAGSLSEAIVIRFAVFKAATS